jgi:hypothetical protein
MERRLRAVEQMDPAESATILALPVASLEDREEEVASSAGDEDVPGAA